MPNKRISWHTRVPIELAMSMLEPTLGWDKSAEVVEATAGELGLPAGKLTLSQILRIFEALGSRPDLVGVAARFARTRLEGDAGRMSTIPPGPESPKDALPSEPAPAPESPRRWIPVTELVDLLAPSLGVDKSTSLVAATGADLGLAVNKLDMHGALTILSRLAKSDGLVGVVAKFAKAQLILKVTEPAAEDGGTPDSSPVPSTERSTHQHQQGDKLGAERLDELARKAGIAWVEWLQEDFAERRAEVPTAFPETHHGARVWLMRALPRASREALKEQDLDRMVHILFESARREWEGTTSSQV